MIGVIPPAKCSGCGACFHICPVKAIAFLKDNEGFYYPEINREKCISCGLCEGKCPVLQSQDVTGISPVVYACHNRNAYIRKCSSSGGVFSLLAEHVLKLGGIVAGCDMTADCYEAVHKIISNENNLSQLRGSKYLQSRSDLVYPAIREALVNGKTVLFSGTPCQVAGLNAYLYDVNTDYLITVDTICHGAPSPEVWRQYVQHWETVECSKVVSVQFRNKDNGWKSYSLVLSFENGKEYRSVSANDLFCRGFVGDYFLRRSCYDCHSKGEHHAADVTLGDFWGIQNICAEMDDNRGTSLVILNTQKGKALFQQTKKCLKYRQVDLEESVKHNPSYSHSSLRRINRECFMKNLHKKRIIRQLETYCGKKIISRIKRKIILLITRVV